MGKMNRMFCVFALASFFSGASARANYIYSFKLDSDLWFGWGPEIFGWSVEVPNLLTKTTSFSKFLSTNVDGCTISASIDNPLSSGSIGPSVVTNFGGVSLGGVPCHGSVTQGFPAPFSSPGTYVVSNPHVTSTMEITAVSEPASLALLTGGLMALAGVLRRKCLE